jgi:hypothetical protein
MTRATQLAMCFVGISGTLGCQTQPAGPRGPLYHEYPQQQQVRVQEVCNNVAASHFVVEQRRIYFKQVGTGEELVMPHYNTALPDGYYFCGNPLVEQGRLE